MKPILFTITVLVFSLANTTIQITNSNNDLGNNFTTIENSIYLNQNLIITNEEIISSGCSSCHMQYALDGKSLVNVLNENFDADLLVHKSSHPKYIKSLKEFLATHSEETAANKYVDYKKLVDYLAKY